MPVTEIIASSNAWCLERSLEKHIIVVQRSATNDRHFGVPSKLKPAHREDWIRKQMELTVAIFWVSHTKAVWIGCQDRVLTCITAMKHLDHRSVPVFRKSMMTVDRHLVGFTIIVTLNHVTCVVNILRVSMPYVL